MTVVRVIARLKNGIVLMSLAAIAIVYSVSVFLSIPLNYSLVVAPLLMGGVYGLNHLTDDEEDQINQSYNSLVTDRPKLVGAVSIAAYIFGLVLAMIYDGLLVGLLSMMPMCSLLLYSFPSISIGNIQRVKDTFIINSALVALAWVAATVLLPVIVAQQSVFEPSVLAVAAFIFIRWFLSVEVANIPDAAGDRAAGVSTFPTKYGKYGTKKALLVGEFVSLILIIVIAVVTSRTLIALSIVPLIGYTSICSTVLTADRYQSYLSTAWDFSFILMGIILLGVVHVR